MIKFSLIFLIIFVRSFKSIILSLINKDNRYEFFKKYLIDNNDLIIVGKGPGFVSEYKLAEKYIRNQKGKIQDKKVISLNGSVSKEVKVDLIVYELCDWRDHISLLSNVYKEKYAQYPILLHGNPKTVPQKVWKKVKKFLKFKLLEFTTWGKILFFSRISLNNNEYYSILYFLYFYIKKLKLPLFIWLRASLPSVIIFLALNSKCKNIYIVGCPMSEALYKEQKNEVISMIDVLKLSFFIAKKAGKNINYVADINKTNPVILNSKNIKILKIDQK